MNMSSKIFVRQYINSKIVRKLLPLKYIASSYESNHTLDISQAIERLLESRRISFSEEEMNRRDVTILRSIRQMRV